MAIALGLCGVGVAPRALAKNHHPLPEVIMLDEEPEEPPPKRAPKTTTTKPAPKIAEPDPEDPVDDVADVDLGSDADAQMENSVEAFRATRSSSDQDRIVIRDENESAPDAPATQKSAPVTTQKPAPQPPPATRTVAAPAAPTTPTAPAAPAASAAPTTPAAPAASAASAAPAPASSATGAIRKSFSSFTTEVQDVPASPSVAAPTGATQIMPLAHEALKNPDVRDPLEPPDLAPETTDADVDPATLPRVLPPKLTPATASTKKPKAKLRGKKPKASAALKSKTKRRAASTSKTKKAAGAVFEQTPAPSLTDDPDAPYRDPALDQEADEDVEEISGPFPDRDPAEEDGDVRTFKDTIRSIVDFNNQWEVNFVNHGRYRIRGQPNELFDYQQSGQYLEIQVLESERRILSIQPTKVRFRQIR